MVHFLVQREHAEGDDSRFQGTLSLYPRRWKLSLSRAIPPGYRILADGRGEFKESLRTKDYNVAIVRYGETHSKYEAIFDQLRRGIALKNQKAPTLEQLKSKAASYGLPYKSVDAHKSKPDLKDIAERIGKWRDLGEPTGIEMDAIFGSLPDETTLRQALTFYEEQNRGDLIGLTSREVSKKLTPVRSAVDRFVAFAKTDVPLKSINRAMANTYRSHLIQQIETGSIQSNTANKLLMHVRKIITFYIDNMDADYSNPFLGISGQTILRYNTNSFGEIFHIHGDVSNPTSIVLTKADYDDWTEKKKYVSAKLLTYFAEHPVFILGYGLGDSNVKSILRDIGELVADEHGLIPNVYQVVWRSDQIERHPPDQAVFAVDGKEYRIHAIHTNDFRWVFEALKSQSALKSINPKLVRALAARTMKLVRHDIPSGAVEVNYETLEKVADEKDYLPTLLGITSVNNPNQSHPLTISQLAHRLGLPNWQAVHKLIHKIKVEKGCDLRSSDNRYHCRIKTGTKATSMARKWSHDAVNLFKKVTAGEDYDVAV